jgi:DNA-binding transcriptional MocR family regulator
MVRFSQSVNAMQSSAVRELMKVASDPDMISFAGGMPNPDLFPVRELDEIYASLSLKDKQTGFQYGPTSGHPPLLESLSEYLRAKGLPMDGNDLIITAGSLQAINLVTKVFVDAGDVITVEIPCFVGAIPVFKFYQAELRGVPMDDGGVLIPELDKALNGMHPQPRLLYLTPYFHNPAGIVYGPERQRQVLNLLQKSGVVLLEDDAYGELYFEEKDRPVPMKAMADDSLPICYTGSFSKIFGPGMRLGWLLAPRDVVRKCELAKQGIDACSSTFTQVLADAFLRRGMLEGYLKRLREAYARRAKRMLDSLEAHMPKSVKWTVPRGGFYIWVQLPSTLDASELLEKSIRRGTVFVVGKAFDPQGKKNDCLRLSFSHTPEDKIEEGIRKIAEAMQEKR